jgi:outer membrane lipoprotein-sorting protein
MKLFFMALMAAFLIPLSPAHALDNQAVAQAEEYLRGLTTARADFIQRSSAGSVLTGKFYLDRPGRLRFEYNEVKDFIVADGLFIYFYDAQMKEQSNAPIGQTLADFLLRKDLTLTGDLKATESFQQGGFTFLTLVQKNDPGAGRVQLVFSDVPFVLRKWRITDPQGDVTEVELKNMERDIALDDELFAYYNPERTPLNQ